MKPIFIFCTVLVLVLLVGVPASAQLLQDNFTAAAGTALTDAGWTISGTSTTNALTVTATGLTFTGYASSGIGNGVPMANTGQDVFRSFTPVTSDSVYLAFMANISAVGTGDYFIAFSPSALQTNYYARLHVKSSGSGYVVGISKSNEVSGGAQYGSTVFSLNTTYLFVVKFKFIAPATAADTVNDPISVYCLPSGTSLTTEPAIPEIANYLCATKVDPTDLGYVTLRQGGGAAAAPTLVIDGIRVAKSWNATTQPVTAAANLTFLVNTATVPDTVNANYSVVLVGTGSGSADTALTTWGSGKALTNIGGDYWKTTFKVNVGDTMKYKIRIGGGGWEKDLSDGVLNQGHRNYIVAAKDTTFPLQFWNNAQTPQPQYFRPWTAAPDSFINVYVRVNMVNVINNGSYSWKAADKDSVGVRGGGNDGDDLSWNQTFYLKQEAPPGDGAGQFTIPATSFFSGRLKFRKSAVTAGQEIQYKFLLGYTWGRDESNNRAFTIPIGKNDTTLRWVWYNNDKPVAQVNADTLIMTFRADLAQAVSQNGFAYTDTLVVRSGYNNSATALREKRMFRVGISSKFQATDTVITKSGASLYYQYYRTPASGDVREIYYNFANAGASATAEKRRFIVPALANKTAQMIQDTINSAAAEHRMPLFQNSRSLAQNMVITYTCDVRPAIYQLKKGGKALVSTNITNWTIINPDSVIIDGVWMNGTAVGGWDVGGSWGLGRRMLDTAKMWDDGTHGDLVAHDSIYTLRYSYTPTSIAPYQVGQIFKFGIYGCDNEGGFGNNHIENINDANATATVTSQFGSIDPNFYDAWNYTTHSPVTSVGQISGGVPLAYNLDQNYPNPFNPSTKIAYSVKATGLVSLKVFNLLGQVVATLAEGKQEAGTYTVVFDASRFASGVYFYQITAGNFVATKKMMLLK
jgi:hypothetical protein